MKIGKCTKTAPRYGTVLSSQILNFNDHRKNHPALLVWNKKFLILAKRAGRGQLTKDERADARFCLNFNNHRKYHRPSLRSLKEKRADIITDFALQIIVVR